MTDDHVMLLELRLDKTIFENFFCKNDVTFGIQMEILSKLLSKINHDYVDIFLNDTDVLSLSSQDIYYNIKLLEIHGDTLTESKIDRINCCIDLDIDLTLMTNAIKSVSKLGETVQFNFISEDNEKTFGR